MSVLVLRADDQRKGDSYWRRSGNGGVDSEPLLRDIMDESCASGVSKVKYWYVTACA